MKQKVVSIVSLLLLGAILLTGCGQKYENMLSPEFAPETAPAVTTGIEVLRDDTVKDFNSSSGIYRTIYREKDGSENICYTDFATGQEIVLCSQLNCRHDSEACASWIPLSEAVIRPIPVGNKLVLLHGGNPNFAEMLGEAARAKVEIMNLDGTDRHTIHSFEATDMVPTLPRAGLARSANTLYFAIESSLAGNRTIYAANVEMEQVEPIYVMEGEEERIIGGTQDALILEYTPGAYDMGNDAKDLVTQVVKLDLNTREVTPLFKHPYQSAGACANGSYLSLQQDHMLHIYDLETGAEMASKPVVLDETFCWEDMQCKGFFGDYFLVSGTLEDWSVISYRINPETGEATELKWTYLDVNNYDRSSFIIAEYEDQFVIAVGEERMITVLPTLEGEKMKRGMPLMQYGLIAKEDFWNNTGEATPIIGAMK